MPTQEDGLFAKVAVQNKLVSPAQVAAGLKQVERFAKDGKTVPLAQVLESAKVLSRKQVDAVSCVVQYGLTRTRDRAHAGILASKKLVRQADLDTARAAQDQFFKQNRQALSILDILVNKGLLKRDQALAAMREAQAGRAPAPAKKPADKVASAEEARIEIAGKCRVGIKTVSLPGGRKASCLALAGQLETGSLPRVESVLKEVLNQPGDPGKYVVLNLEGLTYMSSAGVGVISATQEAVGKKGGAFELADVPRKMQEILKLVGLDAALTFHSMEAAVAAIAEASAK